MFYGHPALVGLSGVAAGLVLSWLLRPWVALRLAAVLGLTVLAGALSVLIAYRFAGDPALPAWWWLAVTGVGLSLIDMTCHRLPHTWVLALATGGLAVFAILAMTEQAGTGLVRALLAALVVFTGGLALFLALPDWMGFGDITTTAALAIYLGWIGWHAVLLGITASMLLLGGLAAQAWTRTPNSRVAAGPSLLLGGWISILTHTTA
ncbi:hypothetical protein [Saccharopolyspora antimicrobica]|uniref:hypothetical protein n=1 Tax=Saccharopolyspora antimicrobica TaxID=455193 RepID=UPI0011606A87|nr:hypothetical protein [Saccharopolyspora antimicrobica]